MNINAPDHCQEFERWKGAEDGCNGHGKPIFQEEGIKNI